MDDNFWEAVHREAMKIGWRIVRTDDPSSPPVTEICAYCTKPWPCGCHEYYCITGEEEPDFGRYA
jgi:hypothetical protein